MVAVCFVDPSSFFCVCGQVLGVDALGSEDGEVGGVGVKAWAVFADVGIGAGSLCGCLQAVAAGEAGFDGWGVLPSGCGDVGDRQVDCGRRERADAAFRQVQGAFVFGAYGVVDEVGLAQAHLGGDVSGQRHQRLQ